MQLAGKMAEVGLIKREFAPPNIGWGEHPANVVISTGNTPAAYSNAMDLIGSVGR